MRRIVLIVIMIALAGTGVTLYELLRPLPILTVTTWAGPYGRAQISALMQPYGARAHVNVHIAEWDGELSRLRRAVANHAYEGDVIDFELPKAVAACREGLLERIDAGTLPPASDGTPAARDFVAGAIGPCWVGSIVYSQIIVAAPGSQASSLADFFDLERFPGGRGLRRGAKFNLEMALLADGVPPSQVYPALSTEAGLARAFAKLDRIRPAIIWWSASGEPMKLVADGRAALTTALNGDLYDAAIHHQPPVKTIWDRQLYELDVFGVPLGDPKKDRAMDFIRFATGTAPLAGVADWVPYGPARLSALALVGRNPELGTLMMPFLPTAPKNFGTAFAIDDKWWQDHDKAIAARWQAWLDAPQTGSDR